MLMSRLFFPFNTGCFGASRVACLLLLAFGVLTGGCAHTAKQPGLSELNRQASLAFENAMLERAEPMYRTIIERQPDNHDAYFMLGNIYTRMGHLDAAVSHYERALELDSNDARIWYNLYLARVQQAIDTLEQGLIRTPTEGGHNEQMLRQLEKMYELYNE